MLINLLQRMYWMNYGNMKILWLMFFVTVDSPFPGWWDDILFARIWINENREPCAELLANWEDL